MLAALDNSHITIDYLNPGQPVNSCTPSTCKSVRVTLACYTHQPIIPFAALSVPIPQFQTTLPKEFMQSAGNPACAL
jgi:hypothetical protein